MTEGFDFPFPADMHVTRFEDVPDDLRNYVTDVNGLLFFHHPFLVTMLPLMSSMPLGKALDHKRDAARDDLNSGNWDGFVFTHERPYRMQALQDVVEEKADELDTPRGSVRFWKLAADVWVDSEASEDDPSWTELMNSPVPNRRAMTSPKDRRRLAQTARQGLLTVFRGVQAASREGALQGALGGWSWTLSRDLAAWFANRWIEQNRIDAPDLKPYVVAAQAPADLIAAYLTGRSEEEVLIDPVDGGDLFAIEARPAGPGPDRRKLTNEAL